ncbi:MAG: IMP cyclohydrolase [Acutalibacteraceae bacterium]
MNIYEIHDIGQLIKDNSYVGRGIVSGTTENGKHAVAAYFIMGRSENSRNRIFKLDNGVLKTAPFDESKVEDPSLIIYSAAISCGKKLIVTNGDQTDTIYDGIKNGLSLKESLEARCFEPDKPNFTPRISLVQDFSDGFSYEMSILKSVDSDGTDCCRYTFSYPSKNGLGHFIHTYNCDGNPIPSFTGEPERVRIPDDISEFSQTLWNNLNEQNKISLYVRYTDIKTGEFSEKLINKNA